VTGELYSTRWEELAAAEDEEAEGSEPDGPVDPADWEGIIAAKVREIVNSADWIPVPDRSTHDDYRIMAHFCAEQHEGRVREELLSALNGRGAFGRFREVARQQGIEQQWYAYSRRMFVDEVTSWLNSQGIAFRP